MKSLQVSPSWTVIAITMLVCLILLSACAAPPLIPVTGRTHFHNLPAQPATPVYLDEVASGQESISDQIEINVLTDPTIGKNPYRPAWNDSIR